MSFRTSANRVTPANSDQSRGMVVTRRTCEEHVGRTDPLGGSILSQSSAARDHRLIVVDTTVDPTLARPAPSSYIPPGMTDNGNITSSSSQNAGTRTYLQTRRRQPSTSHANPPLGPRPLDLQGSKRYELEPWFSLKSTALMNSEQACKYNHEHILHSIQRIHDKLLR